MVTADTLLINSVLQHLVCVTREADGERRLVRYTVTGELDPELFAEVERERGSAGLSRSAAIRQALEWWIAWRKERGRRGWGALRAVTGS
jgi:predicted secreted Zn-dependent protease